MKRTVVRMPRPLWEVIRIDVARSHPLAAERVGFAFTREGPGKRGTIVLVADYRPLDDDDYIDGAAGATYRAQAIRRVRQRILDTGEGAFHVHAHCHRGRPALSRVDIRSLAEVIPSFACLRPEVSHGAIVLSDDALAATTWDAEGASAPSECQIVGYPVMKWSA